MQKGEESARGTRREDSTPNTPNTPKDKTKKSFSNRTHHPQNRRLICQSQPRKRASRRLSGTSARPCNTNTIAGAGLLSSPNIKETGVDTHPQKKSGTNHRGPKKKHSNSFMSKSKREETRLAGVGLPIWHGSEPLHDAAAPFLGEAEPKPHRPRRHRYPNLLGAAFADLRTK